MNISVVTKIDCMPAFLNVMLLMLSGFCLAQPFRDKILSAGSKGGFRLFIQYIGTDAL